MSILDSFINKANIKHNFKYDYSKVVILKDKPHVEIICPSHGSFFQNRYSHLQGIKCPRCSLIEKKKLNSTTESFIKKSIKIHGDKYDYSKVDYINSRIKIEIICPSHGTFYQSPYIHLDKSGCPLCGKERIKVSLEEFKERANIKHNFKYDYSKVKYNTTDDKILIICPYHGDFKQEADSHLRGKGCKKCISPTLNQLIIKFRKVHGDKYDYSKVEYKKAIEKVDIICKEHGLFSQTPNSHLNGNGCPVCKESHGERDIRNFLIENNIKFESQYRFDDCRNKFTLPFDFYLPEHNLCIEYQGRQHFEAVDMFGGEEALEKTKERDKIKFQFTHKKNIYLLYIRYDEDVQSSLKKQLSIKWKIKNNQNLI